MECDSSIKIIYIQIFKNSYGSQRSDCTLCLKQIIFNVSKKEVGNPGTNMKKIVKKYKDSYKVRLQLHIADWLKQRNRRV
jgi:hypothetical protein